MQALYVLATVAALVTGRLAHAVVRRIPENSPTEPNAQAGLIYTYNNHGTLHYVSWSEWVASTWGVFGTTLAVLIIAALYVRQFGFPTQETWDDHPVLLIVLLIVGVIWAIMLFVAPEALFS